MKTVRHIFIFLMLIAIVPISHSALRLPGMGDDEGTLRDHIEKAYESDIEPAREMDRDGRQVVKDAIRRASEDKAPWKGDVDNLWDMEAMYWPHFDISPWNFADSPIIEDYYTNPPVVDGYAQPWFRWGGGPEDSHDPEEEGFGWYTVGCSLSCPAIRYDCDNPKPFT